MASDDPQGLARRVVVEEDDGLEAERPGRGVLAEDLVADLDGLDRPGAVERAHRRAGDEAGGDIRGRELRRRGVLDEGHLGRRLVAIAERVVPPDVPGFLVVLQVRRARPRRPASTGAIRGIVLLGLLVDHLNLIEIGGHPLLDELRLEVGRGDHARPCAARSRGACSEPIPRDPSSRPCTITGRPLAS